MSLDGLGVADDRLFYSWDSQKVGTLSLQDVVEGLDRVMTAGLMESIEWFFALVRPTINLGSTLTISTTRTMTVS